MLETPTRIRLTQNPMKLLLFLFLSFASSAFASMICAVQVPKGESLPAPRPDQIEFTVAFDSNFETTEKGSDRWPTVIYCSWKNITSNSVSILLKDHDSYHGTLDYVFGIQVRISDSQGHVLTTTTPNSDGWWASAGFSSQMSALMPGDVVVLRPGETVIRSFRLEDVLRSLLLVQASEKSRANWKGAEFTFPSGESSIEVQLWGLVARQPLTFLGKGAKKKPKLVNRHS